MMFQKCNSLTHKISEAAHLHSVSLAPWQRSTISASGCWRWRWISSSSLEAGLRTAPSILHEEFRLRLDLRLRSSMSLN